MFYRQLDSLEEYVLVSQDYRQLEVFRRADQWQVTTYTQGEVPLRSLDLDVAPDAIYRRTGRRPAERVCERAMTGDAAAPDGQETGWILAGFAEAEAKACVGIWQNPAAVWHSLSE